MDAVHGVLPVGSGQTVSPQVVQIVHSFRHQLPVCFLQFCPVALGMFAQVGIDPVVGAVRFFHQQDWGQRSQFSQALQERHRILPDQCRVHVRQSVDHIQTARQFPQNFRHAGFHFCHTGETQIDHRPIQRSAQTGWMGKSGVAHIRSVNDA